MKKTFFKNLFRDIKKTLSRFLSIVIIIAVGVAFYAGVRATSPDMKKSGDQYFKNNNLMDFKLISTLGLTKDDIGGASKIKGVTSVEGSYSLDAVIEKDKHLLVINVNSQPAENGINKLTLVSGRRAKNNNEVVAEEKFLQENGLKVGDTLSLKSGSDSKLEDSLKSTEFKIVGAAESPLYVSAQRQLSAVGNGTVTGFVYILPEVFKSEAYTELYVRAKSSVSESSLLYNANYTNSIGNIENALKTLGTVRVEARYAEVTNTANEKIKEVEDKLSSSKKQAADKFAEGYAQLEAAKNKIAAGKEEIKKNETLYYKSIAAGEKQVVDGKNAILAAEKEINSKSAEIQAGKVTLAEAKNQIADSELKLASGKQQAAQGISAAIGSKVAEAKSQLDTDPSNQSYLTQYNYLKQVYESSIQGKDFDSMYSLLKQSGALQTINAYFDLEALEINFVKAEAEINAGRQQIAANEKLLQEGEAKLTAGTAELEANKKKITEAEAQLNAAKQEGLRKLNAGKAELATGEKEIAANTEKLKAEEIKANGEISKGEAEIQQNKDKIKDIKKPDWYVLGRSTNVGYESYRQDSDRLDNIGKAFPLIFFLVAALVSLTTMTRMVQENRIEIGTFKALGYSRLAIVAHYLIYSFTASVVGSAIGVSFGFKLFPPLIMNAYGSLYKIPNLIYSIDSNIALQAAVIAILFTTIASVAATLEELRETPASLLRPKPPKSGKRILLERVTFLWKRLSFTRKVTARNIFRYKQRFFMTVIGIGACTGLMITGFGLKSGIIGATERQFSTIYKYNMTATLTKNISSAEKDAMKDKVIQQGNIKSILFAYTKNGSVKKANNVSEDAYVVVPEIKASLNEYINLSTKGKAISLNDEGVIVTEKFASLIHKKSGDTFEITLNDKTVKVKIAAVTEQYIQHYIYMSPKYYESVTGEKVTYNSAYGLLKNISEASEESTSKDLKAIGTINSISFKNNIHLDFNKTVQSINSVVLVLIASAGVLAFVVIFNLTNINISERRRELATIKLLGFFNKELAAYIYRENIILTIIGSIAGIFIGILLNNWVISTAETSIMMFMRSISPIYFLISVILTILFSAIVNLAMYSRFDKIDMIESLKSAE